MHYVFRPCCFAPLIFKRFAVIVENNFSNYTIKKKINQYFSEFCRKRIFIRLVIKILISSSVKRFVLIEEIVKDANVLDFYQYGYKMARPEQQVRLEKLLRKRQKIKVLSSFGQHLFIRYYVYLFLDCTCCCFNSTRSCFNCT